MNILLVGELYRYGGASGMMEILAGELRKRGHKVISVYGYNPRNNQREKDIRIIFEGRVPKAVNRRARYWLEKYNLPNLYARFVIAGLVRQEQIDILHFHTLQGGYLGVRDIAYLSRKHRVVWTVHDTWPFTGGCMHFSSCGQWMDGSCLCCGEKQLHTLYENTHKNYRRKQLAFTGRGIVFVTPSGWMADNIEHSFLRKERCERIENGIDLVCYSPLANRAELRRKYKVGAEKNVLMIAAGDLQSKYKGFSYLAEALRRLKEPQRYALLLVGEMDEEVKEEELGVDCHAFGFVRDKSVMNELYNIANLVVLPSLQDTFPTVALEAQAAGTPVVAFPVGGIKEQILESTGWLLSEISAAELAHTIEQIFESEKDLLEKGKMARERCLRLYGRERMCQKYENVYRDLYGEWKQV